MAGEIYQARGPFLVNFNGMDVMVQQGTTVRAGHPLLAGREHLFEPFTVDYEYEPPAPAPKAAAEDEPKTPRTRTTKPAAE